MTVRSRVASAVAVGLLAAGTALAVRPESAPPEVTALLGDVAPSEFVMGLAGLAGLYLLYRLRSRAALSAEATTLVAEPPEEATRSAPSVAGRAFESALAVARAERDGRGGTAELERVRRELRTAAARAYAHANGVSDERAREAVRRGEWTDDARAAAFLGPEAPPLPVRVKLVDWLTGADRIDSRAARAVDEIEGVIDR